MTGLVDCAMHRHSHNVNRSLLHGYQDVTIDEDLITCGHHLNTYSVSSASQTRIANHAGKELTSKPSGKRIDFILFKLAQTCNCEQECRCNIKHSCHGLRDICHGKDPITGLSFSDHQPVTIKLVIKKERSSRPLAPAAAAVTSADGCVSSRKRHASISQTDHASDECSSGKERALKAITSALNFKNGSIFPSTVGEGDAGPRDQLDEVNGFANKNWKEAGGSVKKKRSHSIGTVVADPDSGTAIADFEKEDQMTIEQNGTRGDGDDHQRSTLLDMLPMSRRKGSLTEPSTTTTTILSSAKVHFNPDSAIIPLDEPSLKHLEAMYQLLCDYMNQNLVSKRRFYLLVMGVALLVMVCVSIVSASLDMSSSTLFHSWFAVTVLATGVIVLTEFANRMERTAIKGILEEVSSLISFAPNHLSAT